MIFRVDVAPDEPTSVLFTSGSTGLSKGWCSPTGRCCRSCWRTPHRRGFPARHHHAAGVGWRSPRDWSYGLLITTVLGGTLSSSRS